LFLLVDEDLFLGLDAGELGAGVLPRLHLLGLGGLARGHGRDLALLLGLGLGALPLEREHRFVGLDVLLGDRLALGLAEVVREDVSAASSAR